VQVKWNYFFSRDYTLRCIGLFVSIFYTLADIMALSLVSNFRELLAIGALHFL